jgi:hypothetical protein
VEGVEVVVFVPVFVEQEEVVAVSVFVVEQEEVADFAFHQNHLVGAENQDYCQNQVACSHRDHLAGTEKHCHLQLDHYQKNRQNQLVVVDLEKVN